MHAALPRAAPLISPASHALRSGPPGAWRGWCARDLLGPGREFCRCLAPCFGWPAHHPGRESAALPRGPPLVLAGAGAAAKTASSAGAARWGLAPPAPTPSWRLKFSRASAGWEVSDARRPAPVAGPCTGQAQVRRATLDCAPPAARVDLSVTPRPGWRLRVNESGGEARGIGGGGPTTAKAPRLADRSRWGATNGGARAAWRMGD